MQVCSGAALPSGYRAAVNGADCNDANGLIWRNRYRDADADTFGAGALVCVGNDVGYVDNASDCNDADVNKWQNLTGYTDADSDTFTTGGGVTVCSGASLPSGYRSAVNGADCNDGNASVWQNLTGYTDSDADGYGSSGPGSVCSGASLPGGYVSNNSDCYDSNANARPGQGSFFTTNRGDGSFDYDCNSAIAYDQPYYDDVANFTISHFDTGPYGTVCVTGSTDNYNQVTSASFCGTSHENSVVAGGTPCISCSTSNYPNTTCSAPAGVCGYTQFFGCIHNFMTISCH
ncbi:MAG: hypothetical protein HYW37_01120 [Candidatus Colwellbacteria bacterium]|nr:hypothetical protein [Candidatus Colwellbacteria bacterium]